jgi:hypothetical protein
MPTEPGIRTKRALYDALDKNEALVMEIDGAVLASRQDDWRNNQMKIKKVRLAIKAALEKHNAQGGAEFSMGGESILMKDVTLPYGAQDLEPGEASLEQVVNLVKSQNDY